MSASGSLSRALATVCALCAGGGISPAAADTVDGERLALLHCGRCHVVNDKNRFGGIGSTPSFGALKALADWELKFAGFWNQPPHRAVLQIDGVTEPFAPELPPPITPVELTRDEVEAIQAFVKTVPAKDLGGPVR